MKVLWLGAGASIDAGYPAAARLLPAIDAVIRDRGADVHTAEAWARFSKYRESSEGVARTLLLSPNPEVALTLVDLYAAALEADNEDIQRDLHQFLVQSRTAGVNEEETRKAVENQEKRYAGLHREPLLEARKMRRDFVTALDYFFGWRHYTDAEARTTSTRDYVRRMLEWVESGDVIITTNWDTIVERTLLEEGRWTPADGFGFPVRLHEAFGLPGKKKRLPSWTQQQSDVRVLKLHGSYGWRQLHRPAPKAADDGDVFLEFAGLLQYLDFRGGEKRVWARDDREPAFYDSSAEPSYVLPSYVKQLEGITIQRVWSEAASALRAASQIRIVGASLPTPDVAIRALLNDIRFRLTKRDVAVEIHNPDVNAGERWLNFLGSGAVVRRLRAGDEIK